MVKNLKHDGEFKYYGPLSISPVQSEYTLWGMAPLSLDASEQQWQLIGMKDDKNITLFDYIGRMDEIGEMVIDLNKRDRRPKDAGFAYVYIDAVCTHMDNGTISIPGTDETITICNNCGEEI